MKKEWVKPEVTSLGMENTNETEDYVFHKCQYCKERFWTGAERNNHEITCGKNPANPPAAGGGDLPTPALS